MFVLTHRGRALGTATPVSGQHWRDNAPLGVQYVLATFEPNPAFAAVEEALALATTAFLNFGFLGPADDPSSEIAGADAAKEASGLTAKFEVADSNQEKAVGGVVAFYVQRAGLRTYYTVVLALSQAP